MFGDNARITAATSDASRFELQPMTLGLVETIDPTIGAADTIDTGSADDIVLAGAAGDVVRGGNGANIVFGDHGRIDYVRAERLVTQGADTNPADIDLIESLATADGGADRIETGLGTDIILGGTDADTILGSHGRNLIFGDNGRITAATSDANRFESQPITLGLVETIDPSIGGIDLVVTGLGDDIVLAGAAGDSVTADAGANIVLGDHGQIDYVRAERTVTLGADVDPFDIDLIESTATSIGGDDTITTGIGTDIILGGFGNDRVIAGNGQNLVFGDNGRITAATSDAARYGLQPITLGLVETISTAIGGADVIDTGIHADIVLGGQGNDTIRTDAGMDIVLGDNGFLDTVLRERASGVSYADIDPADIDIISTAAPTDGGTDTIFAGADNDIILGGTLGDVISGDQGNDLIFGDHGKIEAKDKFGNEQRIDLALLPVDMNLDPALMLTPNVRPQHPFTWTSIDTALADRGGADLIRGNDGDDIILGGQDGDSIIGGAGDDDIIGGHNGNLFASDGTTANNLGAQDGDDRIDGGTGDDTIAGDNADILRTGAPISVRMRALSGEIIYDGDGNALTTAPAQVNPRDAVERFIRLYDHNDAPLAGTFGRDSIAGGADDDVVFGQLGDDDIQGDGSVVDESGRLTVNARATRLSVEDLGGIDADGDDYLEGNGGDDLIWGNLGQDDIIGDSSNLFSLIAPTMRPTGSDTLFGGAGTQLERNNFGPAEEDCDPGVIHSRDADVILGDNGNIFRLVGTNGTALTPAQFLVFNHDLSDAGHKIVPRAFVLLDYTQGARGPSDRGTDDLIHGEGGDDTIQGMTGNDVIFGEAQDDDIYGGSGYDRLYGGTGDDGILGDDGKLRTSRNGLIEPLNNLFTANQQTLVEMPGPFIGAVINVTGELLKIADLAVFELGSADVIYGGLGCDFLHGGAGDDAISGAEAEREFYTEADQTMLALGYNPANPLEYDPVTRKFAAYDAENPREKIDGFLLNFDTWRVNESTGQWIIVNGAPVKSSDGVDRIFGDFGNDWLVGGTGADRMFGGRGDDYHNADDNLDTNGGLNDQPDDPLFADGDFVYGGAGLDVLMGNTGNDRMFDWTGEFNSFIVPFSPFGSPTVNRLLSPHAKAFIQDLATGEGADPTITEPFGELGLVDQDDADWNTQHGGPRDPQPGNIGGVQRDTQGGKEDMANPLDCGCDCDCGNHGDASVELVKLVNGQDANTGTGPVIGVGGAVTWTYLVGNGTTGPLAFVSLVDDAGTPGNTADDFAPAAVTVIIDITDTDGFMPVYVSGDVDGDLRLGTDEVWLFTSAGVTGAPTAARVGQQVNTAVVRAVDDADQIYTSSDKAHYLGTRGGSQGGAISIVKAINAVNPASPTVAEDANNPDRPVVIAQASVPVFTFQVRNLGTTALANVTIVDDAATDVTSDDFAPIAVKRGGYNVGDNDRDNLLDVGETWLYTSSGVHVTPAVPGTYVNVARVTATTTTGIAVADDDLAHYIVTEPVHAHGRMTGGGSIFTEDGMRVTHGFELHCNIEIGPNNLQVNFDGNRFHLENLTAITCFDDPRLNNMPRVAPFDTMIGEGVGRFNGVSGYRIWFTFTDNGEPGKKDFARIEIRDAGGNLVVYVANTLRNGNQQAHPENKGETPLPQFAAAPAPAIMTGEAVMDISRLLPTISAAQQIWVNALGADDARLDALSRVDIRLADLPGNLLGLTVGDMIAIDVDAAGWGGFVDATPMDGSEFTMRVGDEAWSALDGATADGQMDLQSTVLHEMGNAMGFPEDLGNGVTGMFLSEGLRRVPLAAPAPAPAPDTASAPMASTEWISDFVTNVGRGQSEVKPNAAIRLRMDAPPMIDHTMPQANEWLNEFLNGAVGGGQDSQGRTVGLKPRPGNGRA